MAQGIQVWSQTAATNATADSAVNWAEGQAPSSVNDSARAMMASVAKWRDDNNGTLVTTGSGSAYTVTSNQVSTGLVDGYTIAVRFHTGSTSAATLALDSLTAKPIQFQTGTGTLGNEILGQTIQRLTYSSTADAWLVHGFRWPGTRQSISAANIVDATLTSTNFAAGAVTGAKIADTTIATTNIANSAITYAKMQNVAASSIVANLSTSAAAPAAYALGNNLSVVGTTAIDTKYGPKAWVTWTVSAGTPTIQKSFNVTSVTRTAQGIFAIAFTNSMTDQYYAPMGIGQRSGSNDMGATIASTVTPATSGFSIAFPDSGGGVNDPIFASVVVFGN